MKTLFVQLVKSENRLQRWIHDKHVIKALMDLLVQKIIPAGEQAISAPDNLELQVGLCRLLEKFGVTIFKLSRRNEQLRHLHPEMNWEVLSCLANFFNKRRLSLADHKFEVDELEGIMTDCRALLVDLQALTIECEKFILETDKLVEEYRQLVAVIDKAKSVSDILEQVTLKLDEINFRTKPAQFIKEHRAEFDVFSAQLIVELDAMRQHMSAQYLIVINLTRLETVLETFNQPEKFKHDTWKRAIKSGCLAINEILAIDIESPKRKSSASSSSAARYPNLNAKLHPHFHAFVSRFAITEIDIWQKQQSVAQGYKLRDRAVVLRLLSIIGEVSKLHLKLTDSPDDEFEMAKEVRNILNHLIDTRTGRGTLYYLLTNDSEKALTILRGATEAIIKLRARLDGHPGTAESLRTVTDLRALIQDLAEDDTIDRKDDMNIFEGCGHFTALAAQCVDQDDDYTRLACEAFLTIVGEISKPLEHNKLFRHLAPSLMFDYIGDLVSLRNSLSHEIIQLGFAYHANVILDTRQLVGYQNEFKVLGHDLNLSVACLEQHDKPMTMRDQFEDLTVRAQRSSEFIMKSSGSERNRVVDDVNRGAVEFFKAVLDEVLSAFPSLPPEVLAPELAAIITKVISGVASPSKYNLPLPVDKILRKYKEKPQHVLGQTFKSEYEDLLQKWHADFVELGDMARQSASVASPQCTHSMHELMRRIAHMAQVHHMKVRDTGDFLDMVDIIVNQKLKFPTLASTPQKQQVRGDFLNSVSSACRELYSSPKSPVHLADGQHTPVRCSPISQSQLASASTDSDDYSPHIVGGRIRSRGEIKPIKLDFGF